MPMPRQLPIELYALIFQHITSKATLSNLCTISHTFRREAQRILYHTIHLSPDYDHITSWCHLIVENPSLAIQVYVLSLPASFRLKKSEAVERPELRHAVKRALSSLFRLVELHIHPSSGKDYLDPDIFCGHPFHLQVFTGPLLLGSSILLFNWLKFLSEQPGLRHWRSYIVAGHILDPEALPFLTSAAVYSTALRVFTRCPMIRALRIQRSSRLEGYHIELRELKAFGHKLTSLSVSFDRLMVELKAIREAVPNIKFLALRSRELLHSLLRKDILADFRSELGAFPHLTALVLELPYKDAHPMGWPTESEKILSLATSFMGANPTLRRVAFEMRHSRWPCYARVGAAQDTGGFGIAMLEGYDILGPESYRYF